MLKLIISIILFPILVFSGCTKKIDTKTEALKIKLFIDKSIEQKTEENKDKVFKLLLSKISLEDLKREVYNLSQDSIDESNTIELSKLDIELKKEGYECVRCSVNSEDPNMRFK